MATESISVCVCVLVFFSLFCFSFHRKRNEESIKRNAGRNQKEDDDDDDDDDEEEEIERKARPGLLIGRQPERRNANENRPLAAASITELGTEFFFYCSTFGCRCKNVEMDSIRKKRNTGTTIEVAAVFGDFYLKKKKMNS